LANAKKNQKQKIKTKNSGAKHGFLSLFLTLTFTHLRQAIRVVTLF